MPTRFVPACGECTPQTTHSLVVSVYPHSMKNFEALFEAMHEACDLRRQKCFATYFDTGSSAARTKSLFYGPTAVAARNYAVERLPAAHRKRYLKRSV